MRNKSVCSGGKLHLCVQFEEEKELLKITATQKIRELEMFSKFNIPKENIWYSQSECIMESEDFKILLNK